MVKTESRIRIVDDQDVNIRLLRRMLNSAGYADVTGTPDPQEVLARQNQNSGCHPAEARQADGHRVRSDQDPDRPWLWNWPARKCSIRRSVQAPRFQEQAHRSAVTQ